MSAIPSTREVLALAANASEHRSADVVLKLAELEQEIGWADVLPGLCAEHQTAVNRLAELHLIIDHLAANLRGGQGVPPTPQAAAARNSQPAPASTRPQARIDPAKPRPAAPRRGLANHAQQANARGGRADGLLTRAEALAFVGLSVSSFHKACADGRVPQPHAHEGRSPLWRPDQLAGVGRLRGKAAVR
jgi:predicted DNA-binding transcriptional regulator AlpA